MGGAVEQPHSDDMLQVGNRLRYDWLRDCEMFSGSRHAAPLCNCQKDLQLPQLELTTESLRLMCRAAHSHKIYASIDKWKFTSIAGVRNASHYSQQEPRPESPSAITRTSEDQSRLSPTHGRITPMLRRRTVLAVTAALTISSDLAGSGSAEAADPVKIRASYVV